MGGKFGRKGLKMADQSIHDFGVLLNEMSGGKAREEATKEWGDLLDTLHQQALDTHGKAKGRLTVVFDATIDHRGIVALDYEVTTKEPKKLREGDTFYMTSTGGLSRYDERQQALPGVREVVNPRTGEVREAQGK
jgi:hypothetical protein